MKKNENKNSKTPNRVVIEVRGLRVSLSLLYSLFVMCEFIMPLMHHIFIVHLVSKLCGHIPKSLIDILTPLIVKDTIRLKFDQLLI